MLTTTFATLILSRAFGADCIKRNYLCILSSSKNSFSPFWLTRVNIHSLSPLRLSQAHSLSLSHFDLQRQHTHSLSLSLSYILTFSSQPHKDEYILQPFSFLFLPFQLDLLQPRTQPQKLRQTLKETNNQHERRHVSPRDTLLYFYISIHYMKYLVHIHFVVNRKLSIFSLFP